MRILSVDDQADNLYLIEVAARALGHEVVSALNGIEGLRELENQPFDVIVSDILMPEMDGFRFCRKVKTNEALKHIPFVFYTATYTGKKDQELALSLGASRFVIKPRDPAEFIHILEEVFMEAEAGKLPSPDIPPPEEHDYLRAYNQQLIAKLERKIEQLESASKELTAALAEREREMLQRRLAESALRLANFTLENASVGIFWETADTRRFTRVNREACRMTGYAEAELLKMSMADLDPAAHAWDLETGDGRLRPDPIGTTESRYRHKDGHTIPVEVVVSILDFEGLEYAVTFARDITQRHEAERQKAQLEVQLQQAQKMESLGRLTGGIAHDFNNSLSVILGYAEMLKTSRGPRPEAVDAIWEAGIRSRDLVGQLLGFSRQQIISPQPLNLNQLLAGSNDLLRRLIGEDIELRISAGGNLWNVLLDSIQADQVLMNLAANARDAMPSGGKLTFATSNILVDETYRKHNPVARVGEYVLLDVTDTGEGMDTETAVRAFEPFFTTKPRGKGTGLGLATVYGIVRQNRGFIILDSEPGHGASFKIHFPRLTVATATPATAPYEIVLTRGDRKGTILLAEDDDMVREMTAHLLKMLGYTTLTAADARDAIRICEDLTQRVDLVISDVVMPDLKGTALRDRLLVIRPDLPFLFVSGYSSDIVVQLGVLKPDVHFLQKPFSLTDLASRIDELLETAGSSAGAH